MNILELNLLKYNRHWQKGFRYPYKKRRKLFKKLLSLLEKRQIVEITGLRRVGKTVLLLQLINSLLEKATNRFKILYYTFDENVADLEVIFENFREQTQIDYKKEKIFVFLDEIQKLQGYQNQVKVYYDLYPNIKFFLSGSTSLFLKKRKQESLAGRIFSFILSPLDFGEYLFFADKKEILSKPLAFEKEIEREFAIYLGSQFVESINLSQAELKKEYFVSIIRKIIFEDIPSVFAVENPEILWQIVKIVAHRPGLMIDYQTLASNLGISNKTASLYLYYLEEAFLVKKIYNFSKNLLVSERKLKKYYLASTSFSTHLVDFQEKGFLAENFVVSLKDFKFFWRDVYKNEVDFVKVVGEKAIPVEVKYKRNMVKKDLKNILLFLKKFNLKEGVIYSRQIREREFIDKGKKISFKPIFFLSDN